jgi:hypothetical protein
MADATAPGGGSGDGTDDGDDTTDGGGSGRFGSGSAYDEAFARLGVLASFLKSQFLGSDNRINWKGLGSGLIGGLLLAVWQGLIGIPIAFSKAIRELTTPITAAIDSGGASLAAQIQLNSILVWDAANFGVLSIVVNIGAALLAGAIIAWGVN